MRNSKHAGRAFGQRWHRWKNVSTFAAPPFACVNLTGVVAQSTTEIIFEGVNYSLSLPVASYDSVGVQWSMGFNNEQCVEPGETGFITFDLPAWSLIQESSTLMSFVTMPSPLSQRWSLGPIPAQTTIDDEYWSGFRVMATRYIPDWVDIWNAKQPGFLLGNFKIGLVGGLVHYVAGINNDDNIQS